jgi:hypothetical protein
LKRFSWRLQKPIDNNVSFRSRRVLMKSFFNYKKLAVNGSINGMFGLIDEKRLKS